MVRAVSILMACTLTYALRVYAEPPQESAIDVVRANRELIAHAVADYPEVATAVGDILKSIPTNATTLSQAELKALGAARLFSNATVNRELVRLLMVRHEEYVRLGHGGSVVRPQKLLSDDYPAANALRARGSGGGAGDPGRCREIQGKDGGAATQEVRGSNTLDSWRPQYGFS